MNKFFNPIFIFILSLFLPYVAFSQIPGSEYEYEFASIEGLAEQEVARIVLPQIYKLIGKEITITPLPANRAQFEANSGIKAGESLRIYTYGIENQNQIRVPTPYYHLYTSVFSLKNSHLKVSNKNDLKKYKVGIITGVKHTENITKGLEKVYNSNNTKHLFQQLVLGNIDIALTNLSDGELMIKQERFTNIQVLNPSLTKLGLFHYIHKNHKDLIEPINNKIKQLQANGELAKIIAQAEKQVLN